MSYFLGVDLGGTVIKAGIYNLAGEEIAVCEHTANLLSEAEGFAERNMDEMWKAVCIVTCGAVKKPVLIRQTSKAYLSPPTVKVYMQLTKPEIRFVTASSPQIHVL